MSSLDNGVIGKPEIPGPNNRQSTQAAKGRNMDFFSAIKGGDNEKGQITVAPGQVVRGGECIYDQEAYPRNLHGGDRWFKPNPWKK